MAKHEREDEGHSESTAYETRDIRIRPLAVFAAGVAVLVIFSFLVVLWVFRLLNAQHAAQDAPSPSSSAQRPAASAPADEQLRWPEPRVQSRPADDLKTLRAEEDATLTTYGWVDQANGVVRVPIDVAMRLVLRDGLPARERGAATGASPTHESSRPNPPGLPNNPEKPRKSP